MLYVLTGKDAPDSLAQRAACRGEHLLRLERLRDEGRLLLAGPLPSIDTPNPGPAGCDGSLIVAEFVCRQDAIDWLAEDPYVKQGVFQQTSVKPFVQVLP